MEIGLRIDVDTFRGTRDGVPVLCDILKERDITGTFFFSVGPDNMGRHLWRLLRPQFLIKMLRSKAASLYGWDILFKGTAWPGPIIGKRLAPVLKRAADEGHEIGIHAWDHHAWQAHIDHASRATIHGWMQQAADLLTRVTGKAPTCAATPGWRCTDNVLLDREEFPLQFNSDCRGESVFRPVVAGATLSQPQIPNTLPTYDEVIGHNGITRETYNEYLLGQIKSAGLNVLTIHAEVEGIVCADLFRDFLDRARKQGATFVPLGRLVPEKAELPSAPVLKQSIPGRQGWVAVQGSPV